MNSRVISLPVIFLVVLSCMAFQFTDSRLAVVPKSVKITALVAGESWQGQEVVLATAMAGQLHIEAKAEDGTAIKLALFGVNEPGTIQVGAGNMSICAHITPEKSYMSNVMTKAGRVEVTEFSASGAKGSFEFYCGDDKTEIHVSEGSFDVRF